MGWAGVADTQLHQSRTQGAQLSARPWAHCIGFLGLFSDLQVSDQQQRQNRFHCPASSDPPVATVQCAGPTELLQRTSASAARLVC